MKLYSPKQPIIMLVCMYLLAVRILTPRHLPWRYFYIKEMDFTGIENVFDDRKGENGNTKTIYNLNGGAVENPTNGIYIINGKKVLVK